jgi:predicted Fe-Mo cluster-binding NifX family protein
MDRAWLPVALALVLLSPWPILALGIRPPLDKQLIAAPAVRRSLDSPISTVFSRGRYFLLFDGTSGRYRWVPNPYRKAPHAAGVRSAYLLLGHRAGVILAKRIGPEPFARLTSKGARVFDATARSPGSTLRHAIAGYRRGALRRTRRPTAPSHYGLKKSLAPRGLR